MYTRWHSLVFILLLVLDQLTKWLSNFYLDYFTPLVLLPHVSLHLVHNPGAAWGIFAHKPLFLTLVSMAVLGVLWVMRHRFGTDAWTRFALVFLAAGTTGNLIDRLTVGYVTDFINISVIPVFNVADVLINVGVFGLLIDSFRKGRT